MLKILLSGLIGLFTSFLSAQYISIGAGGAGYLGASLAFEYELSNGEQDFANATSFKAGASFANWGKIKPLSTAIVGINRHWGKYNNWKMGAEIGIPIGESAGKIKGVFVYPAIGYLIGRGQSKGFISLGPLYIPERSGLYGSYGHLTPFVSAGLRMRLL